MKILGYSKHITQSFLFLSAYIQKPYKLKFNKSILSIFNHILKITIYFYKTNRTFNN